MVFYARDRLTGTTANPSATLYVDAGSGSDAWTIDEIRAAGGGRQWQTLGRAVWGSTNRLVPVPAQAAQPGDVVSIAAATYTFNDVINDRFGVIYNPANAGTSVSPIVFRAAGQVRLAAPNALAPVVGSNGKDYIHWSADHLAGNNFLIDCYAPFTGSAAADEVLVDVDTGPVVCTGLVTGCLFEGFRIDGGVDPLWGDNYNAFRLDACIACTFKNNFITSFLSAGDDHSTAFTLYGSRDNIIEHNTITNCSGAFAFKDKETTTLQSGNIFRYNYCTGTGVAGSSGVVWSHTVTNIFGGGEDRNFVYQNIFRQFGYGGTILGTTNEGALRDWLYNNVFATCNQVGIGVGQGSNTVGIRVWNNIVYQVSGGGFGRAVEAGLGNITMPAATLISLEHNVYFSFDGFYSGLDGTRTFASYLAAYPDQDQTAPASVNSDPLFTNAAAGDYTLQGGSPALNLGRHPDTGATINAGPYLTGSEDIGIET